MDAGDANERAALLSRAVADAEERRRRDEETHVDVEACNTIGTGGLSGRDGRRWRARSGVGVVGGVVLVVCAALVATRAPSWGLGRRGGGVGTRAGDGAGAADAGEGDVTASDPRLGGHSKREVADAIKHVVEYVKEHEEEDKLKRSDDVGALGSSEASRETWNIPTLLMATPGSSKERDLLKVTLSKLLTTYDVNLVSKNVRITANVDPNAWPDGLDRSVYALKTVFEKLGGDYLHPDFSLLNGLEWIDAPLSRDLDGKIAGAWAALSHHVGTLFGHMYQWQLAKDSRNNATLIVDTDGLNPARLSVPVSSFGAIADHAPANFDVILLNNYPEAPSSKTVAEFADHRGHDIKITNWNKSGQTGLTTYIISSTFANKVFEYASKKGAGYLDSWIVDDLCTHLTVDADGKIVGANTDTATKRLLNCYHAHGVVETAEELAKERQEANKEVVISSKHESDSTGYKHSSSKDEAKSHASSSKGHQNVEDATLTATDPPPWARGVPVAPVAAVAANDHPENSKEVKKFLKSDDDKGKAMADLGAKPFARAPSQNIASEFVSHSVEELDGARVALTQRRHAIARAKKEDRAQVEAMIKRLREIRASGKEASAKDLLSTVSQKIDAPKPGELVEQIESTQAEERREEFGSVAGMATVEADAAVNKFLTDLLR